jgi:hypothetical protein
MDEFCTIFSSCPLTRELAPVLEHRADYSISLIFSQAVGLLRRAISSSQGLYLNTAQHKHRKMRTHIKHPCPRRNSNPQSRPPRDRRLFMPLRPLGYHGRRLYYRDYNLSGCWNIRARSQMSIPQSTNCNQPDKLFNYSRFATPSSLSSLWASSKRPATGCSFVWEWNMVSGTRVRTYTQGTRILDQCAEDGILTKEAWSGTRFEKII